MNVKNVVFNLCSACKRIRKFIATCTYLIFISFFDMTVEIKLNDANKRVRHVALAHYHL